MRLLRQIGRMRWASAPEPRGSIGPVVVIDVKLTAGSECCLGTRGGEELYQPTGRKALLEWDRR